MIVKGSLIFENRFLHSRFADTFLFIEIEKFLHMM